MACIARSMFRRFTQDLSKEWVTVPVNLRASQYEELSSLADSLGISTSRIARRILAQFLADLAAEREANSTEDQAHEGLQP
jgi:hypothetical protein